MKIICEIPRSPESFAHQRRNAIKVMQQCRVENVHQFHPINAERWGPTIYYSAQRCQLVQDWYQTSLCHTERWQVKQTAHSIWLLLTSGSHCLKEVPASVLELLAIKVQFNQNSKETRGLMLIHPCWPHVGHADCQYFQPCQTQRAVDCRIFKKGLLLF